MPKKTSDEAFVINRLRFIAANKRASPGVQIRALNRIVAIAARKAAGLHWAYTVQITDEDRDGEYLLRTTKETPPPAPVNPTVQEMLENAAKRYGGTDGN